MKSFVINPPVFYGSVIVIGLFLVVGIAIPGQAGAFFGAVQASILGAFG
jgi:choline/glycine/proline betaine transport protein